jgi:hypothetical protein
VLMVSLRNARSVVMRANIYLDLNLGIKELGHFAMHLVSSVETWCQN